MHHVYAMFLLTSPCIILAACPGLNELLEVVIILCRCCFLMSSVCFQGEAQKIERILEVGYGRLLVLPILILVLIYLTGLK